MYWNEEKAGWVPSFDMVESASFKNADLFTAVVTVQPSGLFLFGICLNISRINTYITLKTISITWFEKHCEYSIIVKQYKKLGGVKHIDIVFYFKNWTLRYNSLNSLTPVATTLVYIPPWCISLGWKRANTSSESHSNMV